MKSHWLRRLTVLALFFVATTAQAGKLGVLGDSMSRGTHSYDDCRTEDTVECFEERLGYQDEDYSFTRGGLWWSVRSMLGYREVVDLSADGAEWKDAFEQAEGVMADPEVEAVVIALGANDVCHSFDEPRATIPEIESYVDETLGYIIPRLPNGQIYLSQVVDVVAMRDVMVNQDHFAWHSCQGVWDLDRNEISHDAEEAICEHFFGDVCDICPDCEDDAVEFFLKQVWDDLVPDKGPCERVLASYSSQEERDYARQLVRDINTLLAQKVSQYQGQNGVNLRISKSMENLTIYPEDVSRIDCFHPSRTGQQRLATLLTTDFGAADDAMPVMGTASDQDRDVAYGGYTPRNLTDQPIMQVFNTGGASKLPVYHCQTDDDGFVSNQAACEGAQTSNLMGHLYKQPGPGRQPVFRCVDRTTNDRYISLDPACRDSTTAVNQGILGYSDALFYATPRTALGPDRNVASVGPPPHPKAIIEESVMFQATAQPVPGEPLHNLYNCLVGGWDHMLSTDPNCEGQGIVGSVGWVHSYGAEDRLPIYRCLTTQGDHFVSLDIDCEGHAMEYILGYTR